MTTNLYISLYSHDRKVHIGEQNHQNQKLSAGSDMDSKRNFFFSLLNVQSRGRGVGPKFDTMSKVKQFCKNSVAP